MQCSDEFDKLAKEVEVYGGQYWHWLLKGRKEMENKVVVTKEGLLRELGKAVRLDKLQNLAYKIADLVVAKNHDYGDAWQRYGIFAPLIRINDKILRVKSLSDSKTALVADESIKDTLQDIIGYATLALMWIDANGSNKISTAGFHHDHVVIDEASKMGTILDEFAENEMTGKSFEDCCADHQTIASELAYLIEHENDD